MSRSIIRLLTCGSVDDGKSTLIGRLLVETDSVPHDTIKAAKSVRRTGSTIPAGEIDFSLLTDGLEAEREQGITIDVAYRSMSLLNGKRLIIADAPGHEQYTRNMAVAASRAHIALVLVDASRGIRPQTLRHLTICSLMGVERIIIVINKLDAVGYDKKVFDSLVDELMPTIDRLGIKDHTFIPVSALHGDNVVYKSDAAAWYQGPTLLEHIQEWDGATVDRSVSAHLGIQMISRAENFRGLSGTVVNGSFKVGDDVVVLPARKSAKIARLVTFDGDIETAENSRAVTMVLEPDVDATRGDVIELQGSETRPESRFTANLVWLGESELIHSRSYFFISGSSQVTGMVTSIRHKLNINTGEHVSSRTLAMNEIGTVEMALDTPLSLANYDQSRETGNFVIVDRLTMNTVGAGMILHPLRRSQNVTEHHYEITREMRAQQKGQRAKVVWLTGLSGSGKSTIANAVEKKLFSLGIHSYILDGDNLRLGLNKDLGFTKEDRAENVRRVSEVAHTMVDAGLVVIVALVSPFAADRDQARTLFNDGEFLEVWVKTPAEICAERDPKGLYKKAASGEIPNLTGVGQEYESPEKAELVLDGTAPLDESVDRLIKVIL
ncbi:MAG: adenylyl-sulfate kinase, partial [Candidatus Nanopelagicaceae bacterium]